MAAMREAPIARRRRFPWLTGRTITLRRVFTLVAVFAVVCAALKFPGFWGPILFGIALLLVMGMAITAVVDRGSRQAYAIGYTLAAIIYGVMVLATHSAFGGFELDPYSGSLPTTTWLAPVFRLVAHETWIDVTTRQEVPNYVPPRTPGTTFGPAVGLIEYPDRRTFMAVGHTLWTLLFGLVGGYFAQWRYARRMAPRASTDRHESEPPGPWVGS
jgi:hypothetical protein